MLLSRGYKLLIHVCSTWFVFLFKDMSPAYLQVSFSPDGRWLASTSFDKSIKVWNGISGAFAATLLGHVGPVYQAAWSSDSRLLVSASKDSTLKVRKLIYEPCLPLIVREGGNKPF